MYSVSQYGVSKKIETWQIIIPLHDNNGNQFSKTQIDSILDDISLTFPGYTIISCLGFWKDQKGSYRDENYQILIDALPINTIESGNFFGNLKNKLCSQLGQEKIYVTKTNNKEELLSFKEFFSEIGLETAGFSGLDEDHMLLATQLNNRQDIIMQRLGYETLVLRRNTESKKIIWERIVCGIRLKSEFDDDLPDDVVLCAADQLDELGEAMLRQKDIITIGDYEYQNYILEKFSFRPLAEVNLNGITDTSQFYDQEGNPISTKQFIEYFSMSVFNNYMILREENFTHNEIKINVGGDGSMQITESKTNGNYIFHCPAIIRDKAIQLEIIRCVTQAIHQYEKNSLDPISILQTKARNFYIKKRSILRRNIKGLSNH